jgi:hypothetical protein
MVTKREAAFLTCGVGIGIAVPKLVPKIFFVKAVKYYKEVISAWFRLKKIVIEEYHRIDEAIEAEQAFLMMINPNIKGLTHTVTFEVIDDGTVRDIRLHMKHGTAG